MALITEYTLWLVPLCVAVGVGFGMLLYFKNKNLELERRTSVFLSVLRGTAAALICFLLLAPMLKMIMKKVEKPVVIVAVDDSESLVATKASLSYRQQLAQKVNELTASLGDKYDVQTLLIGDAVSQISAQQPLELSFSEKSTNIGALFDEVADFYSDKNVGAVVLLSDGIYNIGANPYYKAEKAKFPVYTVGLGDPELQTDLLISGISHNRQTFKGNFAPVEVKVMATKLAGKKATLTVTDEADNTLYTKQILISGLQHFETVRFSVETKESGIHKYNVQLEELDGEITYKNNISHFFIEVVASREKVAIVYDAPHPDVSALKQALDLSDKYDVEVAAADKFKGSPSDYSLIILHQLPSVRNPLSNLMSQIQKNGTSLLYILGTQTNLNNFNSLHTGLSIVQNKDLMNDAAPECNGNFASFNFSEEAREMLNNYPPLQTFFGDYQTAVSANTFLYQKIGSVKTTAPLVLFNEADGARTGVIAGTGIWQWRVYNYLYKHNHDAFNELVNKIALYLSAQKDKSRFKVEARQLYNENAPVEFSAELYNDSYELVTDPEVSMKITDGERQYDAVFSKQNNGYYLNMGELPAGTYQWTADTKVGAETHRKSGSFIVQEIMLETQNLVADHQLLKNIANVTGGQFHSFGEIMNIETEIKENENIKSIASYEKHYSLLLNSWIYFAALMLLFAIEWFLRKWNGGY